MIVQPGRIDDPLDGTLIQRIRLAARVRKLRDRCEQLAAAGASPDQLKLARHATFAAYLDALDAGAVPNAWLAREGAAS